MQRGKDEIVSDIKDALALHVETISGHANELADCKLIGEGIEEPQDIGENERGAHAKDLFRRRPVVVQDGEGVLPVGHPELKGRSDHELNHERSESKAVE